MDNNKLWKILFFFNVNVLVAIAFVPYTLPFRLYVIKQPGMALDQLSISTNFTVGSNTNFGGLGVFFFWLCWVLVALHMLSPVAVSGGYPLVVVRGLLIVLTSLVVEHNFLGTWALVDLAHRL